MRSAEQQRLPHRSLARRWGVWLALIPLVAACSLAWPIGPGYQPDRIAFVTPENTIATIDTSGASRPTILSTAQSATALDAQIKPRYGWPVWSPDGRRVAFISLNDNIYGGSVLVTDADGSHQDVVLDMNYGYPIFVSWAPNGAHLAMLVSADDTLRLLLADSHGRDQPRELLTGQPLFSSWSPDSRDLIVHAGSGYAGRSIGGLFLVSTDPTVPPERLEIDATGFRAPIWAEVGGHSAFSGDNGVGVNGLFLRYDDGRLDRLADVGYAPAISWSPTGDRLLWASTEGPPYYFDGFDLITADGRARQRMTNDQNFAFFWSPDGSQIAYVTLGEGERQIQIRLIPATGGEPRTIATFLPSREFIQYVIYFDQYSQSSSIWSPDGRSLLIAGWLDEVADAADSTLYLVSIDGQEPPRALVAGRIGFFAPVVGAAPLPTSTPTLPELLRSRRR